MLQQRIEENDKTDSIFQEYFEYVMANNGSEHPTTALEAGVLFEKLNDISSILYRTNSNRIVNTKWP